MTPLRVAVVALAMVATIASSPSAAAPCAGFTDVDDGSPFCPNIQWIKNRQVTLGCNTGVYCPGDPVVRASMAAFLRRLGNALSDANIVLARPQAIHFHDLDGASPSRICEVPRSFLATWPLRARAHAIVRALASTGPADFFARFVESQDNGATWSDVSPMQAVTAADGVNSAVSLRVLLPPRDIPVGSQYSYGIVVGRVPGSTSNSDLNSLECTIVASYVNRNATAPPLDGSD